MASRWRGAWNAFRTSSGRARSRENIVGTHWLVVISSSTRTRRAAAASKRVMTTAVAPMRCWAVEKANGALWYSGPVER